MKEIFLKEKLRRGMRKIISIEDGFQTVMIFSQTFWDNFLREKMIQEGLIYPTVNYTKGEKPVPKSAKDELHEANDFFFLSVCIGSSSSDYFEEVIEKRMGIPPTEQHKGLNVSEDQVFQLCIDFCEFFNERFLKEGRDSLRFAIDWLKDMRENPDDHKKEWEMWNQVVVDVTEKGAKSLGFF